MSSRAHVIRGDSAGGSTATKGCRFTRGRIRDVVRASHVVPDKQGWKVITARIKDRPKHFNGEVEAIEYAARMSRTTDGAVYLHRRAGGIRRIPGSKARTSE